MFLACTTQTGCDLSNFVSRHGFCFFNFPHVHIFMRCSLFMLGTAPRANWSEHSNFIYCMLEYALNINIGTQTYHWQNLQDDDRILVNDMAVVHNFTAKWFCWNAAAVAANVVHIDKIFDSRRVPECETIDVYDVAQVVTFRQTFVTPKTLTKILFCSNCTKSEQQWLCLWKATIHCFFIEPENDCFLRKSGLKNSRNSPEVFVCYCHKVHLNSFLNRTFQRGILSQLLIFEHFFQKIFWKTMIFGEREYRFDDNLVATLLCFYSHNFRGTIIVCLEWLWSGLG